MSDWPTTWYTTVFGHVSIRKKYLKNFEKKFFFQKKFQKLKNKSIFWIFLLETYWFSTKETPGVITYLNEPMLTHQYTFSNEKSKKEYC
jgi:hypothetical protein